MAEPTPTRHDEPGSRDEFGKLVYSVADVARLLGVTKNAVYIMVHRKQIPSRKRGKRGQKRVPVYFLPDEIAAWLRGKGVT